jgi:hypothetical protein
MNVSPRMAVPLGPAAAVSSPVQRQLIDIERRWQPALALRGTLRNCYWTPIRPLESCRLASFRRGLSGDAWLFPKCYRRFSRLGCRFGRRWRVQLRLFRSAMVAMVQRLDASGFFVHPQLSVSIFLALVLKVFRNRFRCHSQSVAELSRASCPILVTR